MSTVNQCTKKIPSKRAVDMISDNIHIPLNMLHIDLAGKFKNFDKMGKPNATLREFESNPGLWIFFDVESNITFYVISDCHRKNAYKGTSWEVPSNTPLSKLPAALARVLAYIDSM
jgi:hypothetical protein